MEMTTDMILYLMPGIFNDNKFVSYPTAAPQGLYTLLLAIKALRNEPPLELADGVSPAYEF